MCGLDSYGSGYVKVGGTCEPGLTLRVLQKTENMDDLEMEINIKNLSNNKFHLMKERDPICFTLCSTYKMMDKIQKSHNSKCIILIKLTNVGANCKKQDNGYIFFILFNPVQEDLYSIQ